MSLKPNTPTWKHILTAIVTLLVMLCPRPVPAQEHPLVFDSTDPGVTRSLTNWGLDTCWASSDNMLRGLLYMGTNNVTIVRVGFTVDSPLTNNDVSPSDKSMLQTCINLASMATAATRWDMNELTGVSSWYNSGANLVYPDRWAGAMEACQRYYNRSFWSAEGFNEPDNTANNEGSPQNLYDIFGYLQTSTNFAGALMEGGSTLNDDPAVSWFNPIASRAGIGSTHTLAGSAANYVNLIQTVVASNSMAFNPEMHNVMEALMGVNYGMSGGIWWGTAELARGSFIKASQGSRLAYADDLNNWTAAAVYRAPTGNIQAFVGGNERMATTTAYRLFSKDRAVFFDGNGPQRDYALTIPGGTGYQANQPNAERVVNIAWGADVQPAIGGRYIIVNRNSGLALEVPGGSTAGGTFLDQNNFGGFLYQEWDVNQVPSNFGGDYSYFTLTAAHDGFTADDYNWSYASGNQIDQWNGGTNALEQWYFEYTGSGYFKIHNKWSTKVLDIQGGSASAGAAVVQSDDTGAASQQWRLVPASAAAYDFVAPAAPTGVAASANAASVKVTWNANSESDLAGYTVLRATNSGGPYDIVARGLTNTVFVDGSANQTRTYYYAVAASDKSLNQSPYSSQASATPVGGQTTLVAYNFEQDTADASGNGNNAEAVNSPGYVVGKNGAAVSLNGSGQFLLAPAGVLSLATNYTIAAWVYWNGGNAWQRIFDFGNGTAQYMFLTPSSGNGTLRFAVTTNGGGGEQVVETSPLATGKWVHVAVTYNGSTASLYTNGVLAASGAVSISPASFNPAVNYLGASQYPADPGFNGDLDEFYIYNYALTGAQVANLASGNPPASAPAAPTALVASAGNGVINLTWVQATNPGIIGNNVYRSTNGSSGPYQLLANLGPTTSYSDTTVQGGVTYFYAVSAVSDGGESALSSYSGATVSATLVAYLKFDETSGTTASDSSGNGWNGTLVNGATFVAGYSNNAVNLAAANSQYVTLPTGVVGSLGNFSIAAWVNLGSVANWNRVFDFGTGTTAYMFLTPQNGANGKLRYAITTSSTSGEQQINSSSVVPTNGWHHLAVTLSGTVGVLYLDGVAVGTNTAMTLNPSSLGSTVNNYIGKSQWADPYLNGKIDEFRIYNGALSAAQVAALAIPTAPTGLTAAAQTTKGTIKLTWTQSKSLNITTNGVYRATTSGGPYTKVASIAANTTYTNTGLTTGTTYYYVVTAVSSTGVESGFSNQASATSK